jgi:hypothetical protein
MAAGMARLLALAPLALLAGAAHAVTDAVPPTRPVALLAPVEFAPRAVPTGWVERDCDLPRTVQNDLLEVFRKTGVGGETASSTASGYVLRVAIERVSVQKGGAWSGPKMLSLSAKLYGDGVLLRSTEVSAEANS